MQTTPSEKVLSPAISVLLPVYNAVKYVGIAIESVLNQSFKDFELIICEDRSTDMTWQIIELYVKKDRRIKLFRNEKNLGIAENRNKLISLASGNYIVWQDADDVSMPYRLELQYQFMEQNPDVGIVGGWLQFFNENGEQSIRKYASDDVSLRSKIFQYSPVAQPAAMIRKKSLDESGMYDLRYPLAEDLDMSFRIGMKYKFANIQRVLIKYRENTTSATFTKLKTIELNTLDIRWKYSHSDKYAMTVADRIYNLLHYASIFVIPAKLKIKLFNVLRNDK